MRTSGHRIESAEAAAVAHDARALRQFIALANLDDGSCLYIYVDAGFYDLTGPVLLGAVARIGPIGNEDEGHNDVLLLCVLHGLVWPGVFGKPGRLLP
jgi:hypothetical protein